MRATIFLPSSRDDYQGFFPSGDWWRVGGGQEGVSSEVR